MVEIKRKEEIEMKIILDKILLDNPYQIKQLDYIHQLDTIKTLTLYEIIESDVSYGLGDGITTNIILSRGINFTKAKVRGPAKFIKEREKELNPNWRIRKWEYISNNDLISGMLGGVISYGILALFEYLIK